ncbi:MAG: flagellar hook-associated protein FlgK [Planctomycetota bacterium]
MTLFSSLQTAANTLNATQIGLQVVGQNIANANTPGYIRERTIYSPAPVQKLGNLTVGNGVQIDAIVQNVDRFLENRVRDAGSDLASAELQQQSYLDLQAILGELTDTDISSSLNDFFNAIDEVANDPQNNAVRNLAVQAGVRLTTTVNTIDRRVRQATTDLSSRVDDLAVEVNSLSDQISQLNYQIVNIEAGGASEAGALRSERNQALTELAGLIDITATELDTGVVNVAVGGELLVFEATKRDVESIVESTDGELRSVIRFEDNNAPLSATGGQLEGLYESRDTIYGGFSDRLDEFAQTLAQEFNRVYSQGQGTTGFDSLTGVESVTSASVALDEAGLNSVPVSGGFDLLIRNTRTELTERVPISIDLNGIDGDTTLDSLAAAIDAADGVTASVTLDNRLQIQTESSELEFAFEGDTSGVLASLGLNTFFTGTNANSLSINQVVVSDGSKFAASLDGIGADTQNALALISLNDEGLSQLEGGTFTAVYDQLINETTSGATVAESVAEGFRVFSQSLEASSQAITGVNLDEETIDMIQLQSTYQAAARYIGTITELLDILVNL